MSEIKFSKEKFDTKVSYLNYMRQQIPVDPSWALDKGECDSAAINEFLEIYEELRVTVRDYTWSLDNLVESLTNVGEAIYQADQNSMNGLIGA